MPPPAAEAGSWPTCELPVYQQICTTGYAFIHRPNHMHFKARSTYTDDTAVKYEILSSEILDDCKSAAKIEIH